MAEVMIMRLKQGWAVKAIVVIVVASILFRCVSAATNHSVGGPSGWDLSSNVQVWSATTTFHVGDSLVFKYTPAHDVLEVNQQEFTTCRSTNPINTHDSGSTVIQLTQPGPRYFMCGRRGHCDLGLKFRADVLPELENSRNETRRGGGGGEGDGRSPRRPPSGTPPPPREIVFPPPGEIVFPPPSPDENHKTPGPCANTSVGGMMSMARWLNYWWVSFSTLILFSIFSSLSGFSLFSI